MKQQQIRAIFEILGDTYPTFDESDDPWMTNGLSDTPFRSLVSAALSTVTTTPRVVKAAVPLYEKVSTFDELAALDDGELRDTIRSVAHYNRKTQNLKEMSRQILEKHDGQVPRTREELLALKGIGRKCTDLIMTFLNGESAVAVDTHVHRTVNRLGMVHTTTAEDTADELDRITPAEYRRHAHEWLVQHGGKVCTARSPKCSSCPLRELCAWPAARG